jgi:ferredoxin
MGHRLTIKNGVSMRVSIEKDGCIGCGLCESICPNVFRMDNEGKAEVIASEVGKENEADCLHAAKECPVTVIKIS